MSDIKKIKNFIELIDLPNSEKEALDFILEISKNLKGLDELDKKYIFRISAQINIDYSRENYINLFDLIFTLGQLKGKSDIKTKAEDGIPVQSKINLMMPAIGSRILKQMAQVLAKTFWEYKEFKYFRTTEMTELVYSKLDEYQTSAIHTYMSGSETKKYHARCLEKTRIPGIKKVREWVSEIAPPRAKIPGRPKIN